MNLLILIFAITLFTVTFIQSQIEDFALQHSLKGIIVFAGTIFLTLFAYLKLKRMNISQIIFGIAGLFSGIFTGILLSLPLLIFSLNLKPVAFIFITGFGYAGAVFGLKKAETIKIIEILNLDL